MKSDQCPLVYEILSEAGSAIRKIYRDKSFTVSNKNDHSPVTQADIQSHNIISSALLKLTPQSAVVSEEGSTVWSSESSKSLWLLDPLDGTREFIRGNGDFVISLAYLEKGQIQAGFLLHPLSEEFWYAWRNEGAFKIEPDGVIKALNVRNEDHAYSITCLLSRAKTPKLDVLLPSIFPNISTKRVGSALKFAYLAEGLGDLYLRFHPSYEWDTAAGQIIVEQAGGFLKGLDHQELSYGKVDWLNPPFIAFAYDACYQRLKNILSSSL